MVSKRRDSKQRATLRRSLALRDPPPDGCGDLGGPCPVYDSFCNKTSSPSFCCSNLLFVLKGACDVCEYGLKAPPLRWDDYHLPAGDMCSNTSGPPPLPAPTASNVIPSWAKTMVSATPTPDEFNFQAALDIIHNNFTASSSANGDTSSSATATPSLSSAASQSSIATSSSDGTPPASPTSSISPVPLSLASKASSTPVGAIVGGIIGALVVLALIGAGIWYIRRRRRGRHMAPSAAYKAALRAGNPSPMPYQPVYHDSPQSSTDDLTSEERPQSSSGLSPPSRPVSIHSESRFREHTTT